jgi:holo-ACP synthase CitX/triphosphoribosyl-dephospho-CoA synthase CitG
MNPQAQFAEAQAVTLRDMLEARERRVETQKALLKKHRRTLVAFTLNIPGQYKVFPLAQKTFAEGVEQIEWQMADMPLLERQLVAEQTGDEAYFIFDAPAEEVKRRSLAIEEGHPLGRLFDMDVFDFEGKALRGENTGRSQRTCIICGGPVWACSRSRTHSAEELALRVAAMMQDFFAAKYADWTAEIAVRALLYEVSATPKPGLVDRADNGAHRDMDIFTFINSAESLTPYFRDVTLRAIVYEGDVNALLPQLRFPGRRAESAMLDATKGINTHKGAVFTFGLLCAAMGLVYARGLEASADTLLNLCAQIAGGVSNELENAQSMPKTNGERAFSGFGLKGIRGEAAMGYPNIRQYGFPALKKAVESGASLNDAGVMALVQLIAHVEDTNIVARSNFDTLNEIRTRVAAFLEKNPSSAAVLSYCTELNKEFIEKGISPGGSADLLAASYFLYFFHSDKRCGGALSICRQNR